MSQPASPIEELKLIDDLKSLMCIDLKKYLGIQPVEETNKWNSAEFLNIVKGSLMSKLKCSEGQDTDTPWHEPAYAIDELKKEYKWINHYNAELSQNNPNIK